MSKPNFTRTRDMLLLYSIASLFASTAAFSFFNVNFKPLQWPRGQEIFFSKTATQIVTGIERMNPSFAITNPCKIFVNFNAPLDTKDEAIAFCKERFFNQTSNQMPFCSKRTSLPQSDVDISIPPIEVLFYGENDIRQSASIFYTNKESIPALCKGIENILMNIANFLNVTDIAASQGRLLEEI